MSKIQLAVMDTGEANRRILNKDEYRADFRRVEAAVSEGGMPVLSLSTIVGRN